jgi:hypothetical protein
LVFMERAGLIPERGVYWLPTTNPPSSLSDRGPDRSSLDPPGAMRGEGSESGSYGGNWVTGVRKAA